VAINIYEKRALLGAVGAVIVSLALISYATWGMGISVATCIPLGSRPFEQASVNKRDSKVYEVHYVARMWAFEPSVLRVPTGSTLDIYAVTRDVTHGLEIAGTNVNLMLVPGAIANGRVHFTKPGIYTIVCHEYCGRDHQNMNARIEVSDQIADYSVEGLPSSEGLKLLDAKGCLACHSVDGKAGVGPTFKGAWGARITLANGTIRTLDAAMFQQKVLHPDTITVKDFPPVMPVIPLTDDEITKIEAYLEGLQK
jgi:cytochrome c oxidase subunit 2